MIGQESTTSSHDVACGCQAAWESTSQVPYSRTDCTVQHSLRRSRGSLQWVPTKSGPQVHFTQNPSPQDGQESSPSGRTAWAPARLRTGERC